MIIIIIFPLLLLNKCSGETKQKKKLTMTYEKNGQSSQNLFPEKQKNKKKVTVRGG